MPHEIPEKRLQHEACPAICGEEWPRLYEMRGLSLPKKQAAVVTPVMGRELDLHSLRIPVRKPKYNEVVVRIAWTGICRSDVCFSIGPEPGFPKTDHIAGHEGIGHVVQSYDPTLIGQPVGARYLGATCESCHNCINGVPESCASQEDLPKHHNGTFQQYMTVPRASLMLLPKWVFDEDAGVSPARFTAAFCSGSAALKALHAAKIQPCDVVVISGIAGAIGHIVGMLAKQVFKARVIGIDFSWKADAFKSEWHDIYDRFLSYPENRTEITQAHFQQTLLDACNELRSTSSPYFADAAIFAASSSSGLNDLPSYVRDGGSIVCIGVPRDGGSINIPLATLVERQLNIRGTLMGGEKEVHKMLEYIRSGVIQPRVTEIGLDDIQGCMHKFLQHQNIGKMVARINGPIPLDSFV